MTNPMESPELHVDLARAEACAWLARLGGDVTKFVSPHVAEAIRLEFLK